MYSRLIKRPALLGRLLYHTGQCLLAQTNPLEPAGTSEEMRMLQLHHAHQICGIVAHAQDRSMWTVAGCAMEIAAPSLVDTQEQDEAVRILGGINARGNWILTEVEQKLRRSWDQERVRRQAHMVESASVKRESETPMEEPRATAGSVHTPETSAWMRSRASSSFSSRVAMPATDPVTPPTVSRDLVDALRSADFRNPTHPYQNFWRPASRTNSLSYSQGC